MEINRIEELLQMVYKGSAWHGPNIKTVLGEISAAQAVRRIGDSHNIAELVGHMTAWRFFAIQKLNGQDDFDLSDEENFVVINKLNARDWKRIKDQFHSSQDSLCHALKLHSQEKLIQPVSKRPYNFYTLLHGIIHHDLYHLGQIVLLTK